MIRLTKDWSYGIIIHKVSVEGELNAMISVKNSTERVVVLYNDSFRREIPIGQSACFEATDLGEDLTVFAKYFTENNSDDGWNIDVEAGWTGKRRVRLFWKKRIYLTSSFELKDNSDYVLEKSSEFLPTIVLLLNRTTVERIVALEGNKTLKPRELILSSEKVSKRLRLMLTAELILLLPITAILLITMLPILFEEGEVGVKIIDVLITALAVFMCFDNFYYYRIAKKCGGNNKKE